MESEVSFTKKSRCTCLTWLLALLCLCLLIAVIVLAIFLADEMKEGAPREVLRNEVYVREAGRMMMMMNVSADPCEDFYEYACGGYVANTPLPAGQIAWNVFYKLMGDVWTDLRPLVEASVESSDLESIKKVKMTYESCMDEVEIETLGPQPVLDLLQTLGGWPVLDPTWSEAGLDLVQLMTDLTLMKRASLVNFEVVPNLTHSSFNALKVAPPGIALAAKLVSSDPADVPTVNQYKALALKLVNLLDPTSQVPEQHKIDSIANFVNLETELAKLTLSAGETTEDRFGDMDTLYPQDLWTWPALVGAYMGAGNSTLDPDQYVYTFNQDYFRNLSSTLQSFDKKTIVNWLLWNAVNSLSFQLSPDFASTYLEILGLSAPGITNNTPRWSTCVQIVNAHLTGAVSRMYVDAYFSDTAKKDVTMMSEDLRSALQTIITDATWMDVQTRNMAQEKLAAMHIGVGSAPATRDDAALQEKYGPAQITTKAYFDNVVNLFKTGVLFAIKNFANGQDRNEWSYEATKVNAAHVTFKNAVEICAAILQRTVYNQDYPKFLNFGGIGSFLGHELTHGFDNKGRLFDKSGNFANWWTPLSTDAFNNRSQCLIDQYSKFTFPEYGVTVNGQLTLPENIADNGGLKESFSAYQSWTARNGVEPSMPGFETLSNNQMFFLSWGQLWCELDTAAFLQYLVANDPHSPSKFRVIGPLQNNPDFAKEFNCPAGSYMNPEKKCSVW